MIAAALLALLVLFGASGCAHPPSVPETPTELFAALTGSSGRDFLSRVSEYEWGDGGQSTGKRLDWINQDAVSEDPRTAMQAGQASKTIASFLAQDRSALLDISTGWFGLHRRTLGQVNPYLTRAYGAALTPYQGAMIGDPEGVNGFGDRLSSSDARSAVAVLDTDTDAGRAFADAANQRVHEYLRTYGSAVASRKFDDFVALRYAAELAGVVSGAEKLAGNPAIDSSSSEHWITWAGYEVAVATGARPGDSSIPQRFFGPDGRLLSPSAIPNDDIEIFSTAVENYAFRHGERELGNQFDRWYDDASGR